MVMRGEVLEDGPAGLDNPDRLAALWRLNVLPSSSQQPFNDLARLAAAVLKAPLALISLVDAQQQYLIGCTGLPDSWCTRRELPLSLSFCKYVAASGEPLVVEDARADHLLRRSPAVVEFGIVAYVGVPLVSPDGYTIGVVSVADRTPRRWSAEEYGSLYELSTVATTQIQLYHEVEQRRHTDAEREQYITTLEEALRAGERFLSIAAHELRTPLTSLLGSSQLLQRHVAAGGLAERNFRLLENITTEVQRLDRMIEGLLDVSRAQSGQLQVKRAPLDLVVLVGQVLASLQPESERSRMRITYPNRPMIVLGDEYRLVQVLDHLFQNAIAYSPGEEPIEVRMEQRGDMATVAVSDRGIGIPQNSLPKLFSPFYRAPNVQSLRAGGMGIGLYLVKELIALHDGGVEVTSEEYEGSTFRIYLPLYEAAENGEE